VPERVRALFGDRPIERLVRCVGGLALFGVGIAMLKRARLGLAPWDVFHEGLSDRVGLSFGTTIVITSGVVMLLWLPLRQRPGIGTLLNAVQIGVVADVFLFLTSDPGHPAARAALLAGGTMLVAVGSGFYIGAGLGPGPRDGVMTGLAERGWRVSIARATIEMSVLALGWTFGGTVGVGTVLFAVAIGPLVAVALPRLRIEPVSSGTPRA